MSKELIALAVVISLITLIMGFVPNDYAKANRYSGCVERLSISENLSYAEMKDVCGLYLK